MRTTNFNNHFIIKAKLFGRLTESSHHLKIKKIDSIILNYFIFVILFETNGIRNTSSCFDYLVDHIISN